MMYIWDRIIILMLGFDLRRASQLQVLFPNSAFQFVVYGPGVRGERRFRGRASGPREAGRPTVRGKGGANQA